MSDVYEKKFLDLIFRNVGASATLPMGLDISNLWVGLGTVASDGSFTELPATGSYARVAVNRAGSGWDAAINTSPALTLNTAAVTFPMATADWNAAANIGYFGVFDAASAGNNVYWGPLNTPKPVLNGDTAYFDVGSLVVTQD
jgi:hypothetical protein